MKQFWKELFAALAVGLGMLALAASSHAAPAVPSAADAMRGGEGSGKGTIGIVCLDPEGTMHFWSDGSAEGQAAYSACVDHVVNAWVQGLSSSDLSDALGSGSGSGAASRSDCLSDGLIQGLDQLHRTVQSSKDRARAARQSEVRR
jgi:hypothetical protein